VQGPQLLSLPPRSTSKCGATVPSLILAKPCQSVEFFICPLG
jgi:hypothetical protein